MKIPLTASLHYVIAPLDGYVHFNMSTCKIEFIVPPLFVLQLSENDYTACGCGIEIHIYAGSWSWQYTNYTSASQLKACLGMSMSGINDTDVTPVESGLFL